MTLESPEFKKAEEPEPIVDVEVNEAVLREWKEEKHLDNEIIELLNHGFKEKVPERGKFILSADNFLVTNNFINEAEQGFQCFKAKNLDDKLNEVRNDLKKIILNLTFEEMEFNPRKPIEMREERIKQKGKEKTIKYFATNRPCLVLVSDGIDWWLERK